MASKAIISAVDEDAWEGVALIDNTVTERSGLIILNNNLAPVSVAGIDSIQQSGDVRQVINRGTQNVTFVAEDEAADGKDRFASGITISADESVYIFYNGLRWEPFTARNVTVEGEAGGDLIQFAVGDRLTPLVVADNVMSWPVPRNVSISEVQAYLTSPAATGTFTVRIKRNGATILSTNITIDAGEQNSVTAAVPPVLSVTNLVRGEELTVDIVDAADGTASGLVVTLIGGIAEDTAPEITTLSLPSGTEAVAYNETVVVSGGNAPLVFTVSDGALPGGLSLNAATGEITGTPTVADTFNFTIRVTDDDGDTDDQVYAVEIAAPPAFSPDDIAELRQWFKADAITGLADNDAVATWEDSSASNLDGSAILGERPVYKTAVLNSLPVVRFTAASSHRFLIGNHSSLTAGEMFVVVKLTSANQPSNSEGLWAMGTTNNSLYGYQFGEIYESAGSNARYTTPDPTSGTLAQWRIYSVHSAANDWESYFEGVSHHTEATHTPAFNAMAYLGYNGGTGFLDGDLAEFILFSRKLTGPERADVVDYLKTKYGIA